MSEQRVLVTGGAGYIGAHVCEALDAAGLRPVVYDDLSLGHADAVRWGPLEQGRIEDTDRLRDILNHYAPVAVMHFAALSSVADSVRNPLLYLRHNAGGAMLLAEAMMAAGVRHLVVSSTGAVYGVPPTVPITEDMPTHPINPYGRSKLMMEEALGEASVAHDLNVVALRYFNAAGASATAPIGERHNPETHIIPLALNAALSGVPLRLNGADYPTRDGTCVRDYVHVNDLGTAHVAALARLQEGALSGFETLNVGTGKGASVREIIDGAERASGRTVPHTVGPRREGDPPRLIADPSRAAERLGWRAQHTDVDATIASAWRFMASDTTPDTAAAS